VIELESCSNHLRFSKSAS